MAFQLNSRDIVILTSMAEYRLLTARQLAAIHQRNTRALRRRLRGLAEIGLIRAESRVFAQSPGRPEGLLSLTHKGARLLRDRKLLPPRVELDDVTAEPIRCREHLILTNDFRIQLLQMERILPEVTVRFISSSSACARRTDDDRPFVHETLHDPDGRMVEFIPDGAFGLTHNGLGKTLLFFLEVDMGTETRTSPNRLPGDLRGKICNYQMLYDLRSCDRYESLWDCRLRGFRLLVLANTPGRMGALCRLLRELGAPDFVCVTDCDRMFSRGVWADIWTPGGQINAPALSILGSKMPQPPPKPIRPG